MSPDADSRALGESFRCFRRAVAARGDERVAVGDVQLRQSLPLRGCRFDLVGRCECSQQRLRLGDLGHFGRRRKAFERRRENGVGVGRTRGGLVKPRQRKRPEQLITARALLFCDPDCNPIGFFGGCGIVGTALQQDVAA